MEHQGLVIDHSPGGAVRSVQLYGRELLHAERACDSELRVNGLPLSLRDHRDPHDQEREIVHLKGERFVNHFTGWALCLARKIGGRTGLRHHTVGIQSLVRREPCDQTCVNPGPGGPVTEAPLYVDTLTVLGWNWRLWDEDTRMVFCSSHSNGPAGPDGHVGFEHGSPDAVKARLGNFWRRIYPGCLVIHGGLFYDAKTGHWLAITCRRPQVGYHLNITDAGSGIGFDFTLHGEIALGEAVQLPEIMLHFGEDAGSMQAWIDDHVTRYYHQAPEWVHRTLWGEGLAWNNQPTWSDQADYWERRLDSGECTGIGYSLVTNRPISSGTTPLGYEPDPNHGSIDEFRDMCHRLTARGVPLLVWMSHSGLLYGGGPDIDEDWFIRGIDGRISASWGSIDGGGLSHINPGHPGYIEYTKRWIRFYIQDCGAKGIYLDCLSWAFPPDFRPRDFMRWPGDTNRMAIRFIEEIRACIADCDPEAILIGEGAPMDAPSHSFSINANPPFPGDGRGPRDFLLAIGAGGGKRLMVDQAPGMCPAAGYCAASSRPQDAERNRYLAALLRERGGSRAWTHLLGDCSLGLDHLIVPEGEDRPVGLPQDHAAVIALDEVCGGGSFERGPCGDFEGVPTGIYRLRWET